MSHITDTQSRPIPMPRHSGLLCRKGRYYLNIRVPNDLRPLYGKQEIIRKSLGTSDHREAISKVRFEAFKLDAEFAEKRRENEQARRTAGALPQLREISEQEAHALVFRWFIGAEKLADDWWQTDGINIPPDRLADTLDDLRIDETVYCGGNENLLAADGSAELDRFLKCEGVDCPKDSPAYKKLRPLFRMGKVENLRRTIDRVTHQGVTAREPLFREVFAHTPEPPARQRVTLGEMLTRFSKWLTDAGRTNGTQRTYELPSRILREVFGEGTTLDAITKDEIERLFDLLRRVPANATKRYRGFTLAQAVEAADKRGDNHRLGGKTLANYFNNIVAIFNFAVGKQLIADNPAKDRYLRATFERDGEDKQKALFTTDDLNRLFRAPLYTGCKDDGHGYATRGNENPRRGRFWLPLISLFHGLRCNEAAQLYTEDVCEAEGVPFFEIREERADGAKCDKRLKTKQSKRRVPIHPEIIRIGFLDFVAERRREVDSPRLFPDLPLGATGYFSNPFSKWFGRFLESILGKDCKATFHSFRHAFRDALREASVPIEDVEALGGWELMARSAERQYGKGPSLRRLREQMEKTNFPGLDLSHLQPDSSQGACRVRVRSRPPAV